MVSCKMLERSKVCTVVIDVQDSLLHLIDPKLVARSVANQALIVKVCQKLGIPLLWTEQYRKGLGGTTAELDSLLQQSAEPIDKVDFSCLQVPEFINRLTALGKSQIIVVGMETHVCILQTVLELRVLGYEVHIPRDAVLSRFKEDWETGLRIMEQAGAAITSTETALFQLFRKAGGPEFKYFSGLLRAIADAGLRSQTNTTSQ